MNEASVRMAAAEQGMFFEDEDSYEKYPEFKAYIENIVFGSRGSAMRTEIKTWRAENATKDEKTYFAGIMPKIFKEMRGGPASKKRSFGEDVARQAESFFKTDSLDQRKDCLLTKNLLPLRTSYAEAAAQGVPTAKPAFVYSLRYPRYPDLDARVLTNESKAEIGVAPGVQHAFFSVDNKGSQESIEAAENQAMRAGATLVSARRYLNRKAKSKVRPLIPGNEVTSNDAVTADAATITDVAMSDPFVSPAAGAEAHTTAPGPQANKT